MSSPTRECPLCIHISSAKKQASKIAQVYEVIAAAIRGKLRSRKRQSAYIYSDAILHFMNNEKLLPRGVLISAPSVQDWAMKTGHAVRKLVACLSVDMPVSDLEVEIRLVSGSS